MQQMQITVENNSISNSGTVDFSTNTNFGSHMTQVFKGIAGLFGLSALGGLIYRANGWFGWKTTNTEKASIEVLDDKGKSLVESSSNPLVYASVTHVGKFLGSEPNQKAVEGTPKQKVPVNDITGDNKPSEDNIFSTDDLVYRGKAVDLGFSNHQRKLLSTTGPSSSSYLPSIDLSGVSSGWGFKLNGEVTNDGSGFSVSVVGDINGDGIDDLVLGAPYAFSQAGASYVVFGKKAIWNSSIALSSLDGVNGFKLNGEAAGGQSGVSVSVAGDINGDGIDDLVIGAYRVSNNAGATYVVFGKKTAWASPIALSSLNGVNGFKLNGEAAYDWSGNSVSAAGDINGDGIDDLVIGASYAGAAYVVFGKKTAWASQIALSSLNGVNGFKLNGAGFSAVSDVGDINGDGIDDLVIGDPYADAAYVVFGKKTAWASPIALSSLNGVNGFKLNGEAAGGYCGNSVSAAGDINGDGINDLIIGAPHVSSYAGASYVVVPE